MYTQHRVFSFAQVHVHRTDNFTFAQVHVYSTYNFTFAQVHVYTQLEIFTFSLLLKYMYNDVSQSIQNLTQFHRETSPAVSCNGWMSEASFI